jgi:hypothetical protein
MMKSRSDSTQHEAQNARNLLLWGQEVFSWADYWQARMCGVPKSMMNQAHVVMVQRNAAGILRVSLNSPLLFNSPKSGGSRGLKAPHKEARQ